MGIKTSKQDSQPAVIWPDFEFSTAVEAPSERRLVKSVTLVLCLSILVLFIWSIFTNVHEIAKTQGQVVPLGHKQVIQSQRGGTIGSVLVEEGDTVLKGQPLVNFISIDSQSSKDELDVKRANLMLRIERYNAFLSQRDPDFSEFEKLYPDLVQTHQEAFYEMKQKAKTLLSVSEAEINKTQQEIAGIDNEFPSAQEQLRLSNHMLNLMQSSDKRQAISELEFNTEKQKHESYVRELKSLTGKKNVLQKTLIHLQEQLKEKQAAYESEVSELRTEAQTDLIGTEARLRSSRFELQDNVVRSPVEGIIQSIPTTNEGSVIQPGGTVAIIVPMTKTAMMETKLSPRDIGFVKIGQKVKVKIDAFDYSRYGALEGVVEKISPTTDADERGGVYYKVRVSIAQPYFLNDPEQFKLIPGMTGEADIVTGNKTVFEYLWKPVFTNITTAFGER
ncbi:HlyD family type I secretion periplasmic adaptor subunit [Vibrio rumoiensis]|uniref:HlyD family type I secretion periplasmic adaptor subunit n=1 Tax=Vibrio rumoiensis TaxID=76258 RepID=UPI000B5C5C1E|nr:HlyD family type I secretion periplasmic adaptor subunit [Vibrio rumoiensis]